MSKFLTLLLIVSFLSVGMLGMLTMESHGDCLLGEFGACASDVLSMINVHMSVFSSLSSAVFNYLPLFIIALIFLGFGLVKTVPAKENYTSYKYKNFPFEKSFSYKEPFYKWLAVHENSPSPKAARI